MSALFLRQLSQKTHRGLEGRVRAGKSAGGISYGYRMDRQILPDGTLSTGDRVIDDGQAAIIRGIFEAYVKGKSARSIAIDLNRDGIAPPRNGAGEGAGRWSFSTISCTMPTASLSQAKASVDAQPSRKRLTKRHKPDSMKASTSLPMIVKRPPTMA